MIKVRHKGDYKKAMNYLGKLNKKPFMTARLERYAQEGVIALMSATPVETGLTRDSWYYKVIENDGQYKIEFCNSNIIDFVPIAIILQYGHKTKNGGWVEGKDYINPAIQPVFDKITDYAWKEVTEQ